MPQQKNQIDVTVWPSDGSDPIGFTDVNYVSFVSSPGGETGGTYGIPAKLAESDVKREGLPVQIVYVNPANIAAMHAVRKA